jgi:hypothetical protein
MAFIKRATGIKISVKRKLSGVYPPAQVLAAPSADEERLVQTRRTLQDSFKSRVDRVRNESIICCTVL